METEKEKQKEKKDKKKVFLSKEQMTRLKNAMLEKTLSLEKHKGLLNLVASFEKDEKLAKLNRQMAHMQASNYQSVIDKHEQEYLKVRDEIGKEIGLNLATSGVNEFTGEVVSEEEIKNGSS